MHKVLIVDDDRTVRHLVSRSLEGADFECLTAASGEEALGAVRQSKPDVVILDIVLPVGSGQEVFGKIQKIDKRIPVIFITARTSSDTAIEAMQLGAYDYVTKPLDLPALVDLVRKAAETRRMMNVPVAVAADESPAPSADVFVGESSQMLEVFKQIGRVASQKVAVLIRGESGTGKELVARAIYQHSDRADEPFLAVNCAAIPDSLLESELFGHEKGAFTGANQQRIGKFEQCNRGTLFLDEVGDMSPLVQGKVLRLLQEQRFERVGGDKTLETDVRIIAATNRDLETMVAESEFREDLLYRLNGVTISLPPLRDRSDDVPALVEYFLSRLRLEMGKEQVEGLSPQALELLQQYPWPGNVRELQSCLRQTLLNTVGPIVVPDFLPPEVRGENSVQPAKPDDAGLPALEDLQGFIESRLECGSTDLYAETIETVERYLFARVLQYTKGNQSRAAEILGITRGKVQNRIRAFDISLETQVEVESQT